MHGTLDEGRALSEGSPFDDLSDNDDEGSVLSHQPRLPHELDELLGEFVDVLYGAEPPDPTAADGMVTDMDGPMSGAIDLSVVEASLSGSQPPSSPASLSAESGSGTWPLHNPASLDGEPFGYQPYGVDVSATASRPGTSPAAASASPSLPGGVDGSGGSNTQAVATAAPPLPTVVSEPGAIGPTTCWGALTKGTTVGCEEGFVIGKAHFKNKFCARCRQRIDLSLTCVRALTPELREAFANPLSEGFWKRAPPTLGGGAFRLVNNTQSCIGPCLIIYQAEPPDLEFAPLPSSWLHDGRLPLCVAKGTLVPVLQMWSTQEEEARARPKRRRQDAKPGAGADEAAGASSSSSPPPSNTTASARASGINTSATPATSVRGTAPWCAGSAPD